jgi:hypothetical protein
MVHTKRMIDYDGLGASKSSSLNAVVSGELSRCSISCLQTRHNVRIPAPGEAAPSGQGQGVLTIDNGESADSGRHSEHEFMG